MKIKWYDENGKKMLVNQKEDLVYLSWEVLEKIDFIRHGFSTRFGGVSDGVCSTMNLSFTRGDKEEAVHENFARIAKAIGFQKKISFVLIRLIPQIFESLIKMIVEKEL